MKKSSIFIMVIFFIVSLFISLLFNSLQSAYRISKEINLLHSNKAFKIELSSEKITTNNFYKILKNIKEIQIEKESISLGGYNGQAIFSNLDKIKNPPLIEGDFFNKNNFVFDKKYCVIGKDLKKLVRYINKKPYVSIESKDYLVIGVMGHKSRSSAFDETFYINFNKDTPIIGSSWIIDGNNSKIGYEKIKENIRKIDNKANINSKDLDNLKSSFSSVLKSRLHIILFVVLIVLALVTNILSITKYYIYSKRKEFGIRRALGASKVSIYIKIIKEYQAYSIVAFFLSQIVYLLIIKIKIMPFVFGEEIMIKPVLFAFLIMLLIGTLISILPIIESNKFHPNEVMKGI